MLQIGRSLVRSQLVSLGFFIDIKSFRSHYGPGVDSASNRNEYQEHFLGGKGGRCVRLTTLPPSCAVIMKSGNFNFLKPSGPLGGSTVVKVLCYKSKGRLFDPSWRHWNFSFFSPRSHYGPGFDSTSNRNEYQERFLGVKSAGV